VGCALSRELSLASTASCAVILPVVPARTATALVRSSGWRDGQTVAASFSHRNSSPTFPMRLLILARAGHAILRPPTLCCAPKTSGFIKALSAKRTLNALALATNEWSANLDAAATGWSNVAYKPTAEIISCIKSIICQSVDRLSLGWQLHDILL